MQVEHYEYDRPLGLYGFESKQRLAEAIMREFGRYEQVSAAIAPDVLPIEADASSELLNNFRLSNLVIEDDPTAHALAICPIDEPNRRGIEGLYYQINLGSERAIDQPKNIFVTHRDCLASRQAREADAEELTNRLDKGELEAVMRMIGKLTTGLSAIEQIPRKVVEQTLSHRAAIERAVRIEPRVRHALQEYNLDDLKELYPGVPEAQVPQAQSPERSIHISEWQEFLDGAMNLFRRESDANLAGATIAIRHEINSSTYYIKLVAEHGQLRGAQILCDDTGAWKTQVFEIDPEKDEAEAEDSNMVSQIWDKDEVLVSLRDGERIQDNMYEEYRLMAAKSLTAALETSPPLVPSSN